MSAPTPPPAPGGPPAEVMQRAEPPPPTDTIAGVQAGIGTVKEAVYR